MACCLTTWWWRHQMETFSALLALCAGNSLVNSPQHKGQWLEALVFSLICAWINGWVNTGEAGDLRRHRAHYGVTIMIVCNVSVDVTGSVYLHGLTNIANMVSNCIQYVVCDEITYPLQNFKQPLKFRNGYVISSCTLLGVKLLIYAGI